MTARRQYVHVAKVTGLAVPPAGTIGFLWLEVYVG
jgi:preprotein translocase subunit Sss1